jgi:hypothetical protein
VVNGGSLLPGIHAGSWVSIFGCGLAYVADPGVSGLTTEIPNGFLPIMPWCPRFPDNALIGTHPPFRTAAGQVVTTTAPTASPVTVTVGNTGANVIGAAVTMGSVGLYQIAIRLPDSIGSGDEPIVASLGRIPVPHRVNLYIANP